MARPAAREAGFTLVELIVVMALTTVVLAMVFAAVFDVFNGTERSAQRTKAERATTLASELLADDLRAARAPDRVAAKYGSIDTLRETLLLGRPPIDATLQLHDIVYADSTVIVFYAERSDASPRAECVSWRVRTSDRALTRSVDPYSPNCATAGAGAISNQLVMPAPEVARATEKSRVGDPFSFKVQVQPNPAAPNPAACTTQVVRPTAAAPLSVLGRDQIVAVNMDLRSFVANRAAHGEQESVTSVAIASRQGTDYRYALGCSA